MALIETRQARIVRLNSNGVGVTDSGVELPYTLVGELVEYEKHSYRGKENYILKDVIETSPRRVTAQCKYYERCGGCLLQHLNEDDYNEFKRTCHSGQVSAANADPESCEAKGIKKAIPLSSLRKQGSKFEAQLQKNVELDSCFRRNDIEDGLSHIATLASNDTQLLTPQNPLRRRLNLVFSNSEKGLYFGFYRYRSDKIVNIDSCIAAENSLSSLLPEIRKLLESITKPSDSGEVFLLLADNGIDVKILLESKDIFNERNRGKLNSLVGKLGVIRLVYSHNKQMVINATPMSSLRKQESKFEAQLQKNVELDSCFRRNDIKDGLPQSQTLLRNDVKADEEAPYVTFAGEKVAVEADCFLQPTKDSDRLLSDLVLKYIGTDVTKRVADLFCGRGTYTIPIIKAGFSVSGFESDKNALGALLSSLRKQGSNFEAKLQKNISREIPAFAGMTLNNRTDVSQRDLHYNPLDKELKDFEIIVINPPRAGALEQVKKILEFDNIEKIVYISCSLESFNRDAKILEAKYKLNQIVAIDQFLWNPHVEIVAEFIKF